MHIFAFVQKASIKSLMKQVISCQKHLNDMIFNTLFNNTFVSISKEIIGLSCEHEYCKDCWRQYLTIKITDDGNSESICCPALKCGIVVDDATVMQLVSDENTRQKYQHLMTNSFVQVRYNY